MTKTLSTSRDPVCGMDVELAQSTLFSTHRDITYHFCCAQCRERFNDIPVLYTGAQRIADIRPIPKRRKLRLADCSELDVWRACQRLADMMGVAKVAVEKGCLLVEYDLRQTILSQIEAFAAAEGVKFKGGLHGLRRRFWNTSKPASWKMLRIRPTEPVAIVHRSDFVN